MKFLRALVLLAVVAFLTTAASSMIGTAQSPPAAILVNNTCNIWDAVTAANSAASFGTCTNPGGSRTIHVESTQDMPGLAFGPTIGGAPTSLPEITANVVIEGSDGVGLVFDPGGICFPNACQQTRMAVVAAGAHLTLRNIRIENFRIAGAQAGAPCDPGDLPCFAQGGLKPAGNASGGAIYAVGGLTLDRAFFHGNIAIGGQHGFNPNQTDCTLGLGCSGASRNSGSAAGGAIYAESTLVVTNSVFSENQARGPDGALGTENSPNGGSGGSAFGADIALGPMATATFTSTIFQESRAIGGNGRYGITPQSVRDGVTAAAGADGARGTCDQTPTQAEVNGKNGVNGTAGRRGSNGGTGGHAVGMIWGGQSVTIMSSAIIEPFARAGTAGEAGIPERGGRGGRGGDGVTCFNSSFDVLNGFGGDGGNGGDNGFGGLPGDRGTATATVDSDRVIIRNTTIAQATAVVPPDDTDPDFPDRDERRVDALLRNVAVGRGGNDATGNGEGTDGNPGDASANLEANEQNSTPGYSALLAPRDTVPVELSYITLVDSAATVPSSSNWRSAATRSVVTDGTGDGLFTSGYGLKSSVLFNLGDATCPNLGSSGLNLPSTACPAEANRLTTDVPLPLGQRPVEPTLRASGPILTANVPGAEPWRMKTFAPVQFGPAPALRPTDRGFPGGACDSIDHSVVMPLDARGAARDDRCDSGAHELHSVHAEVQFFDDPIAIVNPIFPRVNIPTFILADAQQRDNGATLTVEVIGLNGMVDWDGSGSQPPEATTRHVYNITSTATFDYQTRDFHIYPNAGSSGSLTVNATINPNFGDPDATSQLTTSRTITIIDDPSFDVFHGPTQLPVPVTGLARCSTASLDYTVRPTGLSVVPSQTISITPGGTAASAPSLGTTSGFDPLIWSLPALTNYTGSTLTVLVDGVRFQNGGMFTPRVTASGTTLGKTFLDSYTITPDSTFNVTIDGLTGIQPGEQRTITIHVSNLGTQTCNDVAGVALSSFQVSGGTLGMLDGSIGALAHGGIASKFTTFTAPATSGTVTFSSQLTMPGSSLLAAPINFSTDVLVNSPPTVAANSSSLTINEGSTATNSGTFSDATDEVVVTASVGTVTKAGTQSGTWSWSFPTTDGPDDTRSVTITATDTNGVAATTTFQLNVVNSSPTVAADSATLNVNEGTTATNTGTFSDPGLDDVVITASAGTISQTGSRNGTWSWSLPTTEGPDDTRSVTITATDSDNAVSTTTFQVNVLNVAPTVALSNLTVDENSLATAIGTLSDPGTLDSFTVEIQWGDGSPAETFHYAAGTTSFSEQHRYLDDNPTATPSDTYTVMATATDDDSGVGSASANATVNNVAPVITSVVYRDETGAIIGVNVPFVLSGLPVSVEAEFTDLGTQDTHVASIAWGDGTESSAMISESAGSGTASATHIWSTPLDAQVELTLTDDDTGSDSAPATIQVLDPAGAIGGSATRFGVSLVDSTLTQSAARLAARLLGDLTGNGNTGDAENSALSMLARGNMISGLVKIKHASEIADDLLRSGSLDTNQRSVVLQLQSSLALVAKSAYVQLLGSAQSSDRNNSDKTIGEAEALAASADEALKKSKFTEAIDYWLSAVRRIAPLAKGNSNAPSTLTTNLTAGQDITSIVKPSVDTLPPQLLSLAISPSAPVDVRSSAQPVTFALHVTDDLAGIDLTSDQRLRISTTGPSGQLATGTAILAPGVVLDGVPVLSVAIPQGAEPGTWKISEIRLRDNVGNSSTLTTSALAAAGFPTAFNVVNPKADLEPPQLVRLSLSPGWIDVSQKAATIAIRMTVTDDASGVSTEGGARLADFELRSPSGAQSRFVSMSDFKLVSGTTKSGDWSATLTLPRYSEAGTWSIVSLTLQDGSGRRRPYASGELETLLGQTRQITVGSSSKDLTPPTLTGLSIKPTVVDMSANGTVEVQISATDNLSGIDFEPDTKLASRPYGIRFTSPSGAQSVVARAVPPASASGGPLNGMWSLGPAVFPQFSEQGTWGISLLLKDSAGNLTSLSSSQLSALGFPSQIVVGSPSLLSDGKIGLDGGSVQDSAFGDRAEVRVANSVIPATIDIAIDVLSSPLNLPLPEGFSSAESYFFNVQCTPNVIAPLPLTGLTMTLPLRNYQIPGMRLNLFKPDGTKLTPVQTVAGEPGTGVVNAGGQFAVFENVPECMTVVAAAPGSIPVSVDLQPGIPSNRINLKSTGSVPVAIISTPLLDITQVDPATIRVAGAPANRRTVQDVNGDGLDDVIVEAEVRSLALKLGTEVVVIRAVTRDGRLLEGSDNVLVGNK